MIYLDSPQKTLMIVLAGAVTAAPLQASVHSYDVTPQAETTVVRGGVQRATSNNTTDVIIASAPVIQGRIKNIHTIFINNTDTATATVTVKIDDSGTQTILLKQAIAVGESLVYEDKSGWAILSPITPPFVDTTILLKNAVDATKQLRLSLTGLTTGTTRVWTVPDADITVSGSASALTTGRIVYTTTGGLLTADANVTYNGTNAAINPSGTLALSPTGVLTINPTAASTMDNTAIGGTTRAAGKFTTLDANAAVTLSPANANVTLSPTGTGTLTVNPATLGNIDNTRIGFGTRAALQATTGDFSSTLGVSGVITSTSSAAGSVLVNSSGGTNGQWFRLNNTGGDAIFGVESSGGGAVLTGASAYSTTINYKTARMLEIGATSSVVRISDTGLGVFCTPASEFDVTRSSSGAVVDGRIKNSSNTASSDARFYTSVAGASAGDPYFVCDISGVRDWAFGVDNSDSDKFKISGSATLGSSDYLTIDTSGLTTLSTLSVGAATLTAALTYGGVTLSNSVTGTGSMVLSAAPTLTGTVTHTGLTDISGASAGQIKFPATQNASSDANTLDDYEEGTWTPSVGGTASYTTQVGTYTKIGRAVYVKMRIQINAIGTGSTLSVTGLPFTSLNDQVNYISAAWDNACATNIVFLSGSLQNSSTQINFVSATVAANTTASNAIFGNNAGVGATGTYHTT